MHKFDVKDIRRQANGNWHRILTAHGIDSRFLKNKNGPCPFCGGKDRWRWDNKNSDGGGFCHQCEAKGNGLTILAKWLGLEGQANLPKLLEKIAEVLGSAPCTIKKSSKIRDEKKRAEYLRNLTREIWENSKPLGSDEQCPAVRYLRKRGIKNSVVTDALRTHPSLSYYDDGRLIGQFPALVAKVTDSHGAFRAVHRTFITHAGLKADVSQPKMLLGSSGGGSIQFEPATEVLHVAEGVETALAVREALSDQPVWSAISATNLEELDVPKSVRQFHIWADLDRSGTGERAAHSLARRLYHRGIEVFVHLPDGPIPEGSKSLDWLDVYNLMLPLADQGGRNV